MLLYENIFTFCTILVNAEKILSEEIKKKQKTFYLIPCDIESLHKNNKQKLKIKLEKLNF